MTLRDDLKQKKPFGTPTQEATVALLRTAALIRRSVTAVVEPHGITLQQYNVLRILRGAGEGGLPTLDIIERMVEETPGITRLIDRLESKKLVIRKPCKTDRRRVWCCITERGLALLRGLDQPLRDAEIDALTHLSSRQLAQLITLLDKTRTGLNAALTARRSEFNQEAL